MEYKLSENQTMTSDSIKVYESIEEWRADGTKKYGDVLNWKIKCPMCGHIATVKEYKEAGADSPDYAIQNCIGRLTGKGSPKKGDDSGCNWTANGLLGIPKGGVLVKTPDGYYAHIFEFAD